MGVPNVGLGKFLIMILVTWLTPFPGLGNIILLWNYPYYRAGAAAALALACTSYLVIGILTFMSLVTLADISYIVAFVVVLGMRVWMTLDAVTAFVGWKDSHRG